MHFVSITKIIFNLCRFRKREKFIEFLGVDTTHLGCRVFGEETLRKGRRCCLFDVRISEYGDFHEDMTLKTEEALRARHNVYCI